MGAKGGIVVFDMPGIGEDIEADERHYAAYEKVLPMSMSLCGCFLQNIAR